MRLVSCHGVRRWIAAVAALMLALAILFGAALSAAALDDKYRFDDFGMSVKIPKNYYVITRDASRDDEVFETLSLDYDETITAFKAADIYLRAYDPDGTFQISLTVSSDTQTQSVNNYSDLGDAERKGILEVLLSEPSVSSAVEVKHGGNIFFDTSRTTQTDGKTIYINQCNTIINGLQIDLSMQKQEEIVADEAKVLTNIASALEFDEIRYKNNGPSFEWWRLLLWVVILTVLAVLTSIIYKRRNAAMRRRLEERRRKRSEMIPETPTQHDNPRKLFGSFGDGEISFEEALGYGADEDFSAREATELDAYDINVSERDPMNGVSLFEDEGDSIDDRTDYFDTFFKEPTETHSGIMRMLRTAGAYFSIAFRHIGFFFKNLWNTITGKGKR